MRRALTLVEALVVIGSLAITAFILFPTGHKSRHNARRASCQSNLKQIGLGFMQYAADYDDQLPLRSWVAPIVAYTKTDKIFYCPETNSADKTSDYFFNARFEKKPLALIKSPKTLILFGDGQDDAPLNATLYQLPAAWRTDEKSPSWRHLDTANYLFADGHVKSLRVKTVSKDFRMLTQ